MKKTIGKDGMIDLRPRGAELLGFPTHCRVASSLLQNPTRLRVERGDGRGKISRSRIYINRDELSLLGWQAGDRVEIVPVEPGIIEIRKN